MQVEVKHFSFSESGRFLGVDRQTVSDLIRMGGFPVEDHPNRGNAKAISEETLYKLRDFLASLAMAVA